MAAKQILNNVASSNFKLKLSKVGTFYQSHSFQITSAIYTSGRVLLGLPSYNNTNISFKCDVKKISCFISQVHTKAHNYSENLPVIFDLKNKPEQEQERQMY
jgi:hypothetical protein